MCARRFLTVIFLLTLLVVAGAFAIFQWGGDILLKQATPSGHFQAAAAGSGPDYRDPSSWIARPDLASDPSRWTPAGAELSGEPGGAAIFYVHPTTYLDRDRWNAPLLPGGDSETRTRLFVRSQASAFQAAGRVWAPRYRQAAFGAFLLDSKDARDALDLAYRDVAAAFDAFLRANPAGPIVLAGHSQGALHLERLIADKVAGTPLKARIAAAYLVGWPISTTADLPKLGLPACEAADQAGCILSWMSFGDPPNPEPLLKNWADSRGLNGGERRQRDMLCVNPLTGTRDGAAPPRANGGTLVPSADLREASLGAGLVGAQCRNGALIVGGNLPALGPYVLPGNNYHAFDYALFWLPVRDDSARRVAAWRKR